jgi:dTDP-4-amino-4,6-dideoxygalactose transaminase
MAAILIDIKEGDEIIVPSYTFVSTANAFALRGAKIIFIDSKEDQPGMDENLILDLITPKTKAIIPVHYAGVACDMDKIMEIANKYNLFVIEDAAQAIDSYFIDKNGQKKALGSIGHLAAFSFHETKNIISGEGGMLAINDEKFIDRAEIIWEKGTNRSAFFKGNVDKYGWVDVGSSFLPSEITASFLWAQLESLEKIQQKRINIWNYYFESLLDWAHRNNVKLPNIPSFSTNNAHMFYLIFENEKKRDLVIKFLSENSIMAVFHYQSLHKSAFGLKKYDCKLDLVNSDTYTTCLLRLPFFINLDTEHVISTIIKIDLKTLK